MILGTWGSDTGMKMNLVFMNLVKPAAPAHEKKLGYKIKIVNKENSNES